MGRIAIRHWLVIGAAAHGGTQYTITQIEPVR
jgi:hypothetical protein